MNQFVSCTLFGLAAALYAEAAVAPAHLDGKTVALNYTNAQYQSVDASENIPTSGWVSFAKASRGGFGMGGINPKATRNLLPMTRPGQGGIYTYQKIGPSTGKIEVDMWKSKKIDMGRTLILTFTSDNTAVATEEMCGGDDCVKIRNIGVMIK